MSLGCHFAISGFAVQGEHLIIVATEDNLLKGAAAQAVQCANIRFGYAETQSLKGAMMNPLIIKLGGVLLDSEEALERLFSAPVNYRESHQRPLVIVHGGGCVVDELMKGLNLPGEKKNGLRVTPADQIDIITGALAGTANKTLLALAKKHQIAAVGLFSVTATASK